MGSSTRPRTPSAGAPQPPPTTSLPPIPEGANRPNAQPVRRSSLGMLLRRTKSGEIGSKKKQAALREAELERQRREAIPRSPPKLPVLYNGATPPQLQSFGGDGNRPDSVAIVSNRAAGYNGKASMDQQRGYAGVPIPPIPGQNGSRNGGGGSDWVDPYARTESMTHRGRYSYASSQISTINSPRRVRRRKDPTPFNILIIGAKSSGKTSFLNFLKSSLALPPKKARNRPAELPEDIFNPGVKQIGNFESHYIETEIDGERIGLTLWDSEGFEKNVVDLQLREMSSFLESKFEETFTEEMKVVRAPGVQDTHIHCAFLILDPIRLDQNLAKATKATSSYINGGANGASDGAVKPPVRSVGGLDEDFDLQVLRTLQGKTTVVPIISKADTITTAHMSFLKKQVSESLRSANLDPLEALGLDDFDDGSSTQDSPARTSRIIEQDEDEAENGSDSDALPIQANSQSPTSSPSKRLSSNSILRHRRNHSSSSILGADPNATDGGYLPLSIISPDMYDLGVIGRKFPWGFADPLNEEHCDFVKLKESVFSEWRGELREASRELWYEGWRTSRLKHRPSQVGSAR